MSWLFSLFRGIGGYLLAGLGVVAAVLTFGALKKREGRQEKVSQDRERINEAVNQQRDDERRIRADPDDERLRRKRDRLRELLSARGTDDPE